MRDRLIEARGNAAYLILHSGDKAPLVTRFLSAFSHFGVPFRVQKVEPERNWAAEFNLCSGIVLTDSGCLMALGVQGRADLNAALKDNIGLVSYDTDFDGMDAQALEILGVENPGPYHTVTRIHTSNIRHPVTSERQLGDVVTLDRPLEVPRIGSRHTELLQSDSGSTLCLARDDRKVVTFCVPGDIWSLDVCGHCGMLDDVFYRSLVWSAKKPFLTFRLPPLVSAIVDDCTGSYNHFSYVDTMNRYGWKPHLALFFAGIDEVAHEDIGLDGRKIKSLYEERQAEFGPHAIRYNRLFGFAHLEKRCLSKEELEENFAFHDRKIKEWGISPSRLAHMHFGEAGANCLPYLKKRGYEFFTRLLPLDVSWFDVPENVPPLSPQWPYGHAGYSLSSMSEDPHFFQPLAVAGNKTRESTDFPIHADYLWDRTVFWGENDGIDIDGAVDTVVHQIRQAVSSGFYGMVATHEQRIAVMHPWQWDELWAKVADRLSSCNLRYCLLEEAMSAARDLFHTSIVALDRQGDELECVLSGQARETVELQVFAKEQGHEIEPEPLAVPSFETGRRVVYTGNPIH